MRDQCWRVRLNIYTIETTHFFGETFCQKGVSNVQNLPQHEWSLIETIQWFHAHHVKQCSLVQNTQWFHIFECCNAVSNDGQGQWFHANKCQNTFSNSGLLSKCSVASRFQYF